MNQGLVSIIIPAYNSEEHIARAMHSVLEQSYQTIELIVVNDGSTDQTKDIILEMKQADDRIKYFENVNSGVSVARNIGLTHATGEYVGFVDADDYIDQEMIRLLVTKAEEYDCDLVSCTYERVYPDKAIPENVRIKPGYYDEMELEQKIYPILFGNKYLETLLPLNIVTKLFRREIIEEYGISFETEMKFGEDVLFTQEFLLNSNDFYFFAEERMYKYTYNESSATSKHHENKWENLKIGIQKRKQLADQLPEYELEKQLPYTTIISARNAIANASRNIDATKDERLNELADIILDKNVQQALRYCDFSKLNVKNRMKVELMKRRNIKLYYWIQEFLR